MSNRITFDFANMFTSRVGEHGLDQSAVLQAAAKLPAVDRALTEKRPAMAWRDLPYQPAAVLDKIKTAGSYLRENFDTLVILGIGGSALGSKALLSACAGPYYRLTEKRPGACRVLVEDNVDPDRMNSLLETVDLKRTAFHVISKSGNTVETMSQFIIVLELLHRHLGADFQKHLFITTDKSTGILKKLSDDNGWATFTVPDGVGGSFSVTIDGENAGSVNCYNQYSGSSSSGEYISRFYKTGLGEGKHTIVITATDGGTKTVAIAGICVG